MNVLLLLGMAGFNPYSTRHDMSKAAADLRLKLLEEVEKKQNELHSNRCNTEQTIKEILTIQARLNLL